MPRQQVAVTSSTAQHIPALQDVADRSLCSCPCVVVVTVAFFVLSQAMLLGCLVAVPVPLLSLLLLCFIASDACLLVGWLVADRHSNKLVCIRDLSARTSVRAAKLISELQIILMINHHHHHHLHHLHHHHHHQQQQQQH